MEALGERLDSRQKQDLDPASTIDAMSLADLDRMLAINVRRVLLSIRVRKHPPVL
ncbi:hypothetical protein [Variovorax saccharolyticus]|uniref:hypothetical protein n=1 Tax=Variovorax saccharolyticus TaxID=3053516 RepID=UPI0025773769|nr:hypothetical protein [Variovorax sp. J31P216]MDM0029621.1 hypothetical protein [Variovorax sp. J31P216]